MLTYDEIIKYCTDYKIENGIVIDKRTNQQITDENIILKVKSSVLLFKESKEAYQADLAQFGKTTKSQQDYIKKTMEKFGVSNEENAYGVNKLVKAILSSDGHYEENMSGSDLQNSKFSFLVAPKSEYGLAYLKLKFREKGLDIEDLKISQDLTELQHNGISKVIIDFKIKRYEKNSQNSESMDLSNRFFHPRANELNALERQKQLAKQNNDVNAYNSAKAAIEKIIRESPAEITLEEWNSMNLSQQISFVKIKIREAKILQNKDNFNYWSSNLKNLEAKLLEQSASQDLHQPSSSSNQSPEMVKELEEKKDYKFYFDEMMKVVKKYNSEQNMTEEQKKHLFGKIFYNEGYMVERLSNDKEIRQLMTLLVNELGNNEMEKRLSDIILSEMQDKYKQLHPDVKKQEESKKDKNINESNNNPNDLDLSGLINQLKNELNKIQKEYHSMLSDGYIDDQELAILIKMINKVISDGYSLKKIATNQNDIRTISIIIDTLEEEQKKMNKMQNEVEEIDRIMK